MNDDRPQADSFRKPYGLRASGQQRLGAGVNGHTIDLSQGEVPPDGRGPLEERHPYGAARYSGHLMRGSQTRDPAAHDDNMRTLRHPSIVPDGPIDALGQGTKHL